MRHCIAISMGTLLAFASTASAVDWSVQPDGGALVIKDSELSEVLRYQLQPIKGAKLAVDGACYFHPATTPNGVVMTEVAPSDHPHHRGIFLAWVEMHGKKDADFWGWGEHAPKTNRTIVHKAVYSSEATKGGAGFVVRNDWVAEGEVVIQEKLRAYASQQAPANILDLSYTIAPTSDVKLSRWAFSGFCARTRHDGKLEAFGPNGPVTLKNPKHTEPDSDWPDAAWYAYVLNFDDGKTAGVAVVNHPENPPTLWHNQRDIRMLNPCIVAPAAFTLPKSGLLLKYQVVIFDGPLPSELLNKLAADFKSK